MLDRLNTWKSEKTAIGKQNQVHDVLKFRLLICLILLPKAEGSLPLSDQIVLS